MLLREASLPVADSPPVRRSRPRLSGPMPHTHARAPSNTPNQGGPPSEKTHTHTELSQELRAGAISWGSAPERLPCSEPRGGAAQYHQRGESHPAARPSPREMGRTCVLNTDRAAPSTTCVPITTAKAGHLVREVNAASTNWPFWKRALKKPLRLGRLAQSAVIEGRSVGSERPGSAAGDHCLLSPKHPTLHRDVSKQAPFLSHAAKFIIIMVQIIVLGVVFSAGANL